MVDVWKLTGLKTDLRLSLESQNLVLGFKA